jgi:universal stress protein E
VETAENFAITDVAINMVVLQRELLKARNKELEKLVKSAKPKSLKIEIPVLL